MSETWIAGSQSKQSQLVKRCDHRFMLRHQLSAENSALGFPIIKQAALLLSHRLMLQKRSQPMLVLQYRALHGCVLPSWFHVLWGIASVTIDMSQG